MAVSEEIMKEIADKFTGVWREVRNENVEDFFKEVGLNYFLRKLAMHSKPDVTITVNGTEIRVAFTTPFRAEDLGYRVNEEIEVENQKGKFHATTSYENGKVLVKQRPVEGNDSKPMEVEREINDEGEMVSTIRIGAVVCKRYFTKLQ